MDTAERKPSDPDHHGTLPALASLARSDIVSGFDFAVFGNSGGGTAAAQQVQRA